MSKTYLKSDHFNGGIMAKCELDKVGREISPCMASVPRSAIGRRAREVSKLVVEWLRHTIEDKTKAAYTKLRRH
jgi:hypothetical protein